MKIEISIGKEYPIHVPYKIDENGYILYMDDTDISYEHEGYYDTIDEAIEALQYLKAQENPSIYPRCDKCVYLPWDCGKTDKNGKCTKYKRDPPDGGYYG